MSQTPIETIPSHLLRKRGKTYVSIGPDSRNATGFKSRLWNVTFDDRHILVRWGKAVIVNNKVAPSYLQYKLHRFENAAEVDGALQALIRSKLSSSKGYQRIISGVSLIPVNSKSTFASRPSLSAGAARDMEVSPSIFVSYAHRNMRTVYPIVRDLERANLNVWIDKHDMIDNGEPFGVQIQKAIKQANTVVIMMSRQANESDWVALEATYAKQYHKSIVPLYIQPVRASGVLGVHLLGVEEIPAFGRHRLEGIARLVSKCR